MRKANVGTPVTADDADTDTLTYTLGGDRRRHCSGSCRYVRAVADQRLLLDYEDKTIPTK